MIILKNKSLFALIVVSFLLFFGLIFSVYRITTKKAETFYADGYISLSDFESSEKVYFAKGTNYKRGYSKQVIFKDTENVKQEVSKYSFVFYDNKSINYLTDGVLMDLDGISENFIPYYNIKSNYLIEYKDGKYVIDGKNKDVILNNFIGRINDQKYVVAGNNLKLKVSSSEELISGYYFELNFGEGNLVKIDNTDISIETASDECYIMVGDNVKLDLSEKNIYYKDEVKANLAEIIIDNDSNIDIQYQEKPDTGEEPGEGGENGNGNGDGNEVKPTPIEYETEYHTETVIEYKNVPFVEVINSDSNSHQISLDFRVIDQNSLITGTVKVRYTNIKTGYTEVREYSEYQGIINYIIDNLPSNSEFLISIYASYVRNDNIYTDYRMFQRIYTTKTLGVTLAKDYVTSSEASYKVSFDSDAGYESVTVTLYDRSGHSVDSKVVNRSASGSYVIFDNLNSDEKYSVVVEQFNYGNFVYNSDDYIESVVTTLKKNPFKSAGIVVPDPIAIINKKDYTVKFSLGEIDDVNNSIQKVIYNVYNDEDDSLVDSFEKDNITDEEIVIGDKIKAYIDGVAQTYYYTATITIQDNEKLIDYTTNKSNKFNIEAKISPTLSFELEDLTANTARGLFIISDVDNTIDTTKPVSVEYTDSLGNKNTKPLQYKTCPAGHSSTTKCVEMYIDTLNSDDIYTVGLMAYVDTKDEDITPGNTLVGAIKLNTEKADIVLTDISARDLEIEEASTKMFEVNVQLLLDSSTSETVKDNMSGFDIILYEGADYTGTYLATMHVSGNSEIVNNYFDNPKTLTLSDFNLTIDDLRTMHMTQGTQMTKRYTIRLTNGVSGSDYVEFRPSMFTFEINPALLDILNGNCSIEVTPIANASLPNNEKIPNLYDDTIVGLKVTPTFSNKSYARKINFYIVDVTSNVNNYELVEGHYARASFNLDLLETSTIPEYKFYMSDESLYVNNAQYLRRGRVYRVLYTVELDLNKDGITDIVYPFSDTDVGTPEPVVSDFVQIPKQNPSVMAFPWESDSTSITYKYYADDPDNALGNDFDVFYKVGANTKKGEKIECVNSTGATSYTSNYSCVRFNDLVTGDDYEIVVKPTLIASEAADNMGINHYIFEGTNSLSALSYEIIKEGSQPKYDNILALRISDTDDNNKHLNTIAYYTVELSLSGQNKKFKIDNINNSESTSPISSNIINYKDANNDITWRTSDSDTSLRKTAYVSSCEGDTGTCVYIDYSKLYLSDKFKNYFMPFKNQTITVSLSATYDSGVVGYRVKQAQNKYAIQVVASDSIVFKNEIINNKYFILNNNNVGNNSIVFSDSALSAAYLYDAAQNGFVDDQSSDRTPGSGSLYFINSIYSNLTTNQNRNFVNLDYRVNHQGILVNLGTAPGVTVPIVVKELAASSVGTDVDFSFSRIVPSLNISLTSPTLNGVKLNMSLSGVTSDEIFTENGKKYVYLELFDDTETNIKNLRINMNELTEQTGTVNNNQYVITGDWDDSAYARYKFDLVSVKVNNTKVDTNVYSYDYKTGTIVFKSAENGGMNISNGTSITVNYRVVIDNLIHNSDYHIKAYVKMSSASDKVYLAGNNGTYQTLNHAFKTKNTDQVSVQNANFDVESDLDYATRRLITRYNVDDIVGIDNFVYEICNSNNLCVDVTQYATCVDDYNHFDGSCFTKETGYYNTLVKHDISIHENYDFQFNTTYTLKIKAMVTENNTQNTYDIYSSDLMVRALTMPTLQVVKKSHFDANNQPYLQFDVTFYDPDRVVSIPTDGVSAGTYSYYLATGPGKVQIQNTGHIEEIVKNNHVYTANINYDNLNTLTEYYLIVNYNTHANNKDGLVNESFSIPYLIYTLDDNGISIGKLEYQATKMQTILKFGYATNILQEKILDSNNQLIDDPNQEAYVAGINYSITRKSGDNQFRMDGEIIFSDSSHIDIKEDDSSLGDKYYQLTINHGVDDTYSTGYPVTAGYNIIFRFYIGGNVASALNTSELCSENNVSNYWDEVNNKCYILDSKQYNADTIYGG